MSLLDGVRRWEGLCTWLYRDSLGYMTTGIGCLLNDVSEASELPWTLFDDVDIPASADEVRLAWNAVARSPKGHAASWYAPLTRIRLTEAAAERLAQERIDREFLPGLRRLFPGFEALPEPAQGALLDMAFNIGVRGLEEFGHLRDAVARGDWRQAAATCHVRTCRDERNDWRAEQFRACA